MNLIRPFRGLRPLPEQAAAIAAPPYDVLSGAEARKRAAGKPLSFLHVSKAEIDLPENIDPYDKAVYERAKINLALLIESGALMRDSVAGYYAYRLEAGTHVQTGLAFLASLQAYREQRIRRHEFTRPDKEADRTRHVEALGAQTGPAMLAYPHAPELDRLIAESSSGKSHTTVVTGDGVRHTIWPIFEALAVDRLGRAFDRLPALYIADGHHRTAAAERVAVARRSRRAHWSQAEVWDGFLAVAFPHHSMRILEYNRVVSDLGGMSETQFLEKVRERFDVSESKGAVRPGRSEFGLCLRAGWFRLRVRENGIPVEDPVARLDASILSQQLLDPILSIHDLRRDSRVDFIGGIHGLDELQRRVECGAAAAAFVLYPTAMQDLMAVADRNGIMPPKSTWFEPKLVDGLISHVLDAD